MIEFLLVMDSKKFKRTTEDFICKNCGETVVGSGYTNHCPKCLWSQHVDIYPGDRSNGCKGMMKPIGIEMKNGVTRIVHKCTKCGTKARNRMGEGDNQDIILELSINPVS